MNIFSDDEPDLMGLELVREFDNLTNKFYSIFEDDLNKWTESSEIYVGVRSEIVREEVYVAQYYSSSDFRPNKDTKVRKNRRKVVPVPGSVKRHIDQTIGSRVKKVDQDSPEDVIVSDKDIKIVLQLPTNNKKENIKVVSIDDCSISISHLNSEGKRCTRTLGIPYDIDFETAKATYKNGILEGYI